MHQAAVGQKCPRCARTPRRARARGKPQHYLKAIVAGVVAAVVGGLVTHQLLLAVPFGGLILSGVLGFGVGRAVGWGAQRQSQQPFLAIAVVLGVLGGVLAFAGPLVVSHPVIVARPFTLLAGVIAGAFAIRGLRG